MKQMPVTNWPERIALTLLVVGIMALIFWAMRRGWLARAARQSHIPAPLTQVGDPSTVLLQVPGRFVGTSIHGDWLDRVVVHDLGIPSKATLQVHAGGLALHRMGARDVAIPREDIVEASLADAVGADVVNNSIVVTWRLGPVIVDSGFRPDSTAAHAAAMAAINSLLSRSA